MNLIIDIPEEVRANITSIGLVRMPEEQVKVVGEAIQSGKSILKGHWIDYGFYTGDRPEHAYACSACNEEYIGHIGEFKYCPNCGTEIELDNDEEEGK